jgi:hypothetical protein
MPSLPDPGTLLGGHRIVRRLGVGPTGASFEAVAEETGESVVLKALVERRPLTLEEREAITADFRALAALRSDRLVTPRAAGEGDGLFWLIYPFERGDSLAENLAADGALDRSEAIAVGRELAVALAQAHAVGIVHGAVKPTNIFVNRENSGALAQLADFGARLRAVDWQTGPGPDAPSSECAAPETLARGVRDARGDVYSLGCVLHALLSGHLPAQGRPALGLPERDAVDRDLSALLHKMLDPDPDGRPQDMATVQHELDRLGRIVAAAPPDAPVEPAVNRPDIGGGADPLRVAAAAMDAGGPRSGTPPAAPDRDRLRMGAGALRVLAGLLAIAVVIALVAWLSSRTRDAAARAPGPGPTASSSATSSPQPAAPATVTARPAYRAVRFVVNSHGQPAQYLRAGVWQSVTRRAVTVPTSRGAQRVCLKVRVEGAPTARECGTSRPPELAMNPLGACSIGTTHYDHCYELVLAGFRPGPLKVHSSAKDAQGVLRSYTDDVTIDDTGRGTDPARFGTSTPATVQILVGGIDKAFTIG